MHVKFRTGYDVTIDQPIDDVFQVLALPGDLERVLRLSPLVTKFRLLDSQPGSAPTTQVITFEFGERVPMLPGGVCASHVTMQVEQTVDSETRRVDYWSQTKGSAMLSVHKVRTFEPAGEADQGGRGHRRRRTFRHPPDRGAHRSQGARRAHGQLPPAVRGADLSHPSKSRLPSARDESSSRIIRPYAGSAPFASMPGHD